VLRGFIVESDDSGLIPTVFNLTCLVSSNAGWIWFDMDWMEVLRRKNEQLNKQGRK